MALPPLVALVELMPALMPTVPGQGRYRHRCHRQDHHYQDQLRTIGHLPAASRTVSFSAIQAPSMREIPLADQHEALSFGEALLAGHQDVLILLTGVGARMLITTLSTRWPREEVVAALGRLTLVCRGPKPIAALKEVGLVATLAVPEPNTFQLR